VAELIAEAAVTMEKASKRSWSGQRSVPDEEQERTEEHVMKNTREVQEIVGKREP
jgi:hypothetical protein